MTRLFVALFYFVSASAIACLHDPQQRRVFMKTHPCPATGKTYGACPGYIADHRVALCKGGRDRASNLQWQTVAEARIKDRCECSPKGCP